jgi:hypothetical protein
MWKFKRSIPFLAPMGCCWNGYVDLPLN